MSAIKPSPTKRKFRLFPRDLRDIVHQISAPILGKQGAAFATLMKHWPDIVGANYHASIFLRELRYAHREATLATLVVDVAPHLQPEIPYLSPTLMDRSNQVLGHRVVEKILALPLQTSKTNHP